MNDLTFLISFLIVYFIATCVFIVIVSLLCWVVLSILSTAIYKMINIHLNKYFYFSKVKNKENTYELHHLSSFGFYNCNPKSFLSYSKDAIHKFYEIHPDANLIAYSLTLNLRNRAATNEILKIKWYKKILAVIGGYLLVITNLYHFKKFSHMKKIKDIHKHSYMMYTFANPNKG